MQPKRDSMRHVQAKWLADAPRTHTHAHAHPSNKQALTFMLAILFYFVCFQYILVLYTFDIILLALSVTTTVCTFAARTLEFIRKSRDVFALRLASQKVST